MRAEWGGREGLCGGEAGVVWGGVDLEVWRLWRVVGFLCRRERYICCR